MKFERGPIRAGQDENGNIKLFSEVRVIFEDESPEERSYIYQRYQQILEEQVRRCANMGVTRKETEQLFDKYIEEKKNVDPQKDELGSGNRAENRQGKSEVFHEVQD